MSAEEGYLGKKTCLAGKSHGFGLSDSVLPQRPVSGTLEKGFLLFELSLFFCKMGI